MTSRVPVCPSQRKNRLVMRASMADCMQRKWLELGQRTRNLKSSFGVTTCHNGQIYITPLYYCLLSPRHVQRPRGRTAVITPTPFMGAEQKRLFHRQRDQTLQSVSGKQRRPQSRPGDHSPLPSQRHHQSRSSARDKIPLQATGLKMIIIGAVV